MRVYVIYGQGGVLTSYGMYLLANRIARTWPKAVVTTHSWDDPNSIIADIKRQGNTPIVLIGYSLGANCVTWVADAAGRQIELAVCYDPSVLSIVQQPKANTLRMLLYHNTDWEPEGHAVFVGRQVERTEISMFHLAICYSEMLHKKTLAAIARVH